MSLNSLHLRRLVPYTPSELPLRPHLNTKSCHICIVTETYTPEVNGVAMTLARLVDGLRARGDTVSVIRPRQRLADGYSGEYDYRVTLVRGLPLPGSAGLQFGLPAGRALRRAWTARRPDVIYIATEGPLGWSAASVARRLGIPTLSGFHTNFHSYSQHYHTGWLQPVILRYLQAFHNRTFGTLVPSTELQNQLQELGIRNVQILGRGVDTQLFTPARRSAEIRSQWGIGEQDIAVLYVGRIAPEKNLPLAIAAYRRMQQHSTSAKFVIVGDGPLRATLQKEHPDLLFSGILTGEQLATYYASADIFLFPSKTETFGNVTLEAMASGLGVVAYNYAAANKHIQQRKTGIVVPYGYVEGFINAATHLICEPQLLNSIRQQARAHAETVNWQRVVERFEMLLLSARAQSHFVTHSSVTYRSATT